MAYFLFHLADNCLFSLCCFSLQITAGSTGSLEKPLAPKAPVEIPSAHKDTPHSFPSKFTPKPSGSSSFKPPGVDLNPTPTPWAAPQQRKEPQAPVPPPPSLPSAQPTPKFTPSPVAGSPKSVSRSGDNVPMAPSNATRHPTSLQTQFTAPSPSGPSSRPQPPNFTYAQQKERPQAQEKPPQQKERPQVQVKPRPTEKPAAAKDMVRERGMGLVSLDRHIESEVGRMRGDLPQAMGGCYPSEREM